MPVVQTCTYLIYFYFFKYHWYMLAHFPLLTSCMHVWKQFVASSVQCQPYSVYPRKTTVRHSRMYLIRPFYQTDTCRVKNTCARAQTLKFNQRSSCVEYRVNAPDLKASLVPQMWHQLVLSLALTPPFPFPLPILFHQLSPSFDTSEGVPHMPVTSPLLH